MPEQVTLRCDGFEWNPDPGEDGHIIRCHKLASHISLETGRPFCPKHVTAIQEQGSLHPNHKGFAQINGGGDGK